MRLQSATAGSDDGCLASAHGPIIEAVQQAVLEGGAFLAVTGPEVAANTAAATALHIGLTEQAMRVLWVRRNGSEPLRLTTVAAQLLGKQEAAFDADDIERLYEVLTDQAGTSRPVVLTIDGAEGLQPEAVNYLRLLSTLAASAAPQIVFFGLPSFWDVATPLRDLIAARWVLPDRISADADPAAGPPSAARDTQEAPPTGTTRQADPAPPPAAASRLPPEVLPAAILPAAMEETATPREPASGSAPASPPSRPPGAAIEAMVLGTPLRARIVEPAHAEPKDPGADHSPPIARIEAGTPPKTVPPRRKLWRMALLAVTVVVLYGAFEGFKHVYMPTPWQPLRVDEWLPASWMRVLGQATQYISSRSAPVSTGPTSNPPTDPIAELAANAGAFAPPAPTPATATPLFPPTTPLPQTPSPAPAGLAEPAQLAVPSRESTGTAISPSTPKDQPTVPPPQTTTAASDSSRQAGTAAASTSPADTAAPAPAAATPAAEPAPPAVPLVTASPTTTAPTATQPAGTAIKQPSHPAAETATPLAPAVVAPSPAASVPLVKPLVPPAAHTPANAEIAAPEPARPSEANRTVSTVQGEPQEIKSLLGRGDSLMSIGDIVAARLLYQRAASLGSGRAATMVGRTYDPHFLARAGRTGPQPDPSLAANWYRSAATLGDPEARRLLRQLTNPAPSR
ncbi:MAG TPA: AAA family ATPase [Rhodopila sp.]|jgi:hypothetical protein|nr:AAA family ATPase [Rhodopila sp.]